MNQSGKMFFLKFMPMVHHKSLNPPIWPSGLFQRWMKPLKPMDTSRIMHVLTGTRLDIDLSSEGHPGWCQCVQLPGSDFAAGMMMMMMTALSQRRRNSHFSGDCEAAVAPSHP